MKAQISQVSGTYQIKLAPPNATVCDETHPARSVFAAIWLAKRAVARMTGLLMDGNIVNMREWAYKSKREFSWS